MKTPSQVLPLHKLQGEQLAEYQAICRVLKKLNSSVSTHTNSMLARECVQAARKARMKHFKQVLNRKFPDDDF